MTKESEKNLRCDGHAHYLDCGDVFIGVLSFSSCTYVKTYQTAILNICNSLYVNFTSRNFFFTSFFFTSLPLEISLHFCEEMHN